MNAGVRQTKRLPHKTLTPTAAAAVLLRDVAMGGSAVKVRRGAWDVGGDGSPIRERRHLERPTSHEPSVPKPYSAQAR